MKKFSKVLAYLLGVHATALLILTVFRLLFFAAVAGQLPSDAGFGSGPCLTAFLRGVWFDNVIGCYVMALPLLFAIVAAQTGRWRSWMIRSMGVWFGVFYALAFMASAANIPYFLYFTKTLNASIWNWAGYGTTTAGMLLGETSYYLYILYFAAATAVFSCLLRLYGKRLRRALALSGKAVVRHDRITVRHRLYMIMCSAVLAALCFVGIRGRLGYNPIKVSAAYFSTSPVLNNMGLNPMFCLLASSFDGLRPENKTLRLMDGDEAVSRTRLLLGREGIDGISPIARRVVPEGAPTHQNVVMIIMESMSAKLMAHFGNKKHLTPCLDSLYGRSLSFANFYSSGNHTNHGLYATLYSFPSIMFRNAMKGSDIPVYSGLPTVLKDNGYTTMFFMTHESQYDNMNAFFRTNGYDEIYAQENYPPEKVANNFGVQDDYLFSYALPVLRRQAAAGRPFFATLLTISNHPPYVLPEWFRPRSNRPEEQIVEYADRALADFMAAAAREPWADNTIFVILGDHGKAVGPPDCELPEAQNHVPFMIYGKGIVPQERTDFAVQVDVAPTLLSMLRLPYVQNNFGVDLTREQRPAAFYTADKTIAARNDRHLYVYNAEVDKEFCYDLHAGRPVPVSLSAAHEELKSYVFPLLQATEHLVQQGMTTDKPRQH